MQSERRGSAPCDHEYLNFKGAKPCLERPMSPPLDWQLEGTSAWLNELRRADQPGGEYSHNEKERE